MRNCTVKENHIGSKVNEIPLYRQIDIQKEILLLLYKDSLFDTTNILVIYY